MSFLPDRRVLCLSDKLLTSLKPESVPSTSLELNRTAVPVTSPHLRTAT
ncbi:Protein of unknown function [Pyronema omphalodes CBS 100304]|uniref:Uncharacterized protein n=1 Tax=Pyronema omphalodes (strain CBS 100304) TaxID=1076935 RepID=U4L0X6_PYROM|nr:Protein of unknown function [Pyronema omphalodes CBS 100304]